MMLTVLTDVLTVLEGICQRPAPALTWAFAWMLTLLTLFSLPSREEVGMERVEDRVEGNAEDNGIHLSTSTYLSTVLDRAASCISHPPTRGGRVPWTSTRTLRVTRRAL